MQTIFIIAALSCLKSISAALTSFSPPQLQFFGISTTKFAKEGDHFLVKCQTPHASQGYSVKWALTDAQKNHSQIEEKLSQHNNEVYLTVKPPISRQLLGPYTCVLLKNNQTIQTKTFEGSFYEPGHEQSLNMTIEAEEVTVEVNENAIWHVNIQSESPASIDFYSFLLQRTPEMSCEGNGPHSYRCTMVLRNVKAGDVEMGQWYFATAYNSQVKKRFVVTLKVNP